MILFNLFEPLLGKAVSAPFVSAPSSYEDESSKKSSKSSSTKLDKGLGILNEDIVKLLSSGKLLPGDVAKFMDEALNIITYAYDPESGRTSLAPYKMLFTRLSQMQTGYQEWEDVMKKASQNGTLSETAISAQGRVYVMDPLAGLMTKSISLVTSSDRTLTNEELLKARKEDPSFAYNTGLFTTIANAVNPKDITKHVMDILALVKSTGGKSEQFYGLNGQLLQTLQELGESIESGYITLKISNSSNIKQLEEAFKYIANMLPQNMLNTLQLKAAQNGTSISNIIGSLINSELLNLSENSYSVTKPKENDLGSSKKENSVKMSALIQYLTGTGGIQGKEVINPGQSYALSIPATRYSLILNTENNPIQNGSLLALRDAGLGSIGIMNQGIYVGNQYVSPINYNQIAVLTGGMSRVWLPSTIDNNGVEHPDFDILKDFAKLNDKLEQADSIAEKKSIIQEDSKFSKYFKGIDEEGNIQWDSSKFKAYFMVQAFASGETGWMGDTKGVLDPKTLENWGTSIKYMGVTNEESFMLDYIKDYSGAKEDIYATIAYIPVNPSTSDAMTVSGQEPTWSENTNYSSLTDIRVLLDKLNLKPGLMKLPS